MTGERAKKNPFKLTTVPRGHRTTEYSKLEGTYEDHWNLQEVFPKQVHHPSYSCSQSEIDLISQMMGTINTSLKAVMIVPQVGCGAELSWI